MMTKPLLRVFTTVLLVFSLQIGFAQKTFEVQDHPKLNVSGTSTLHDWDMPSDQASGKMVAMEESGKLSEIHSLEIRMPAESIKSGKKAMDKKAYDAMNTKAHKEVIFRLEEAQKDGAGWIFKGSFDIAGKTKKVEIPVREKADSGSYTLSGEYAFGLSEYDITPPTALMGTIKTGNEVQISFEIDLK